MPSNFTANLNVMMLAARKAGRSLVKDFGEVEKLQVSAKSAGDFVSRADIRAEGIIREDLMEARKTYGFLGEESTEMKGEDPTRRWIVDPLDGTTNFLHGMPHWAISIALEHKGEIVSALVYDPVKDEMFVAEKGTGAWLNETRLRVSNRADLIESVFATGVPWGGSPRSPVWHRKRLVFGAGGRLPSIWLMWQLADLKVIGNVGSNHGILPRVY